MFGIAGGILLAVFVLVFGPIVILGILATPVVVMLSVGSAVVSFVQNFRLKSFLRSIVRAPLGIAGAFAVYGLLDFFGYVRHF